MPLMCCHNRPFLANQTAQYMSQKYVMQTERVISLTAYTGARPTVEHIHGVPIKNMPLYFVL